MAIENYIAPTARFSQGDILTFLDDKEVAGGICRMLSVHWVIEALKPTAGDPLDTLIHMKSQSPFYFKQIAQNHKAYAAHFNHAVDGWIGSVKNCIKFGSGQTRDMLITATNLQLSTSADELATRMYWATSQSTTTPRAGVISFSCPLGNHCIAVIEESGGMFGSKWYVFDPNFGVMVVDIGIGETLGALVGDLWGKYQISSARVAPVI